MAAANAIRAAVSLTANMRHIGRTVAILDPVKEPAGQNALTEMDTGHLGLLAGASG